MQTGPTNPTPWTDKNVCEALDTTVHYGIEVQTEGEGEWEGLGGYQSLPRFDAVSSIATWRKLSAGNKYRLVRTTTIRHVEPE